MHLELDFRRALQIAYDTAPCGLVYPCGNMNESFPVESEMHIINMVLL